jgi:hypothetical protein
MTDRTLEWRVEEVCLNTWPALREVLVGGWLLRFSEGLTRRANSANALGALADIDPSDCEALYRRLGQPAIFRVLTLLDLRLISSWSAEATPPKEKAACCTTTSIRSRRRPIRRSSC